MSGFVTSKRILALLHQSAQPHEVYINSYTISFETGPNGYSQVVLCSYVGIIIALAWSIATGRMRTFVK